MAKTFACKFEFEMELLNKISLNDFDSIAVLTKVNNLGNWNKEDYQKAYLDFNYRFIIAKKDDELIGFILFRNIYEEIEVINICVNKLYRRKGIAKKLMERCIEDSLIQTSTKKIWLEVRESNIEAINLYNLMGFVNCGKRKNYYSDPTENAVTMYRILQT